MSVVCAMRDFAIFALCFSSLHTALYAYAARDEEPAVLPAGATVHCPYFDAWSIVFLALVLASSSVSLSAFARGWDNCERWTWVVDGLGILPGILWQISTRPAAYGMGGLVAEWEQCSYEHVPIAQIFRMLGEWLTYGMLLRLTQSAGFGRQLVPSFVVIAGAVVLSGFMYVLASLFRDVLSARAAP